MASKMNVVTLEWDENVFKLSLINGVIGRLLEW